MKKLYTMLVALLLLSIIACGGGGDSSGGGSDSSAKSTISGTVSAPSGTVPAALTVVSLGKETPVSSQGNFSADVYKDGVTVVAAMPEGKDFGLINIVVTDSSQPSGAVLPASITSGSTSSAITLDAMTTAVSLVFTSPFFITNDPSAASTLLPIIKNDPKVAALATVIGNVFTLSDPMDDPGFQQALIDAVQSVINTLSVQNQTVSAAVTTKSSSATILQIPKQSALGGLVSAALLSSTSYYADQDYITVKAEASGTGYGIKVESRNVGSIDWIAEVMKLDASQFSSFSDFQLKAGEKRTIYGNERYNVLGKLNAPAKSVFRYFDVIQLAFDWTFQQFVGEEALDQVPISSTEDGIYLLRSYSGSVGQIIDPDELSFIISEVPNGTNMNNTAFATNILMVCLDTLSLFVDLKSLNLEIAVKAGISAYEEQVSLVNNPTKKNLMLVCVSVIKAMGVDVASRVSKVGLIRMYARSASLLASVIDLTEKASLIGKIADRVLQMLTSGTPMETSYVVVGNPFDSSPPTTSSVSIEGYVYGGTMPIQGAVIATSLDSKTATTDSSGHFYLLTSTPDDLEDTPYTITISAVGYQTYSYEHAWGDHPTNQIFTLIQGQYTVRMSNVDDIATLYINGQPLYKNQWGYDGTEPTWYYVAHQPGDSGEFDITNDLVSGDNSLRFTLWNQQICCGASLSIEVKKAGVIVFSDSIAVSDSSEGIKYDKTFVLTK